MCVYESWASRANHRNGLPVAIHPIISSEDRSDQLPLPLSNRLFVTYLENLFVFLLSRRIMGFET